MRGGRWIAHAKPHVYMGTWLDEKIPLIPWTVYWYLGCYLFWGINYMLAVHVEKRTAFQFLAAHLLGETVCFLFFVCFPTTMERPVIEGKGIAELLLSYVYYTDAADNLFPSIHCFVSWMSWIGVRENRAVFGWYRSLSLLLALAVCVTVLTVKQHVIADMVMGVLLAELSSRIAGSLEKLLP